MVFRKEWLMASATAVITLAISLAVIRWLAPQLLGIPVDLQMVSVDENVSPFYEAVFRDNDLSSKGCVLKDPVSGMRARALFAWSVCLGPFDVLGWRKPGGATGGVGGGVGGCSGLSALCVVLCCLFFVLSWFVVCGCGGVVVCFVFFGWLGI